MTALPKIVIVSTGGTINMRQDPQKRGYVPTLCGNDLVASIPSLAQIADIEVLEFANIPSFHMNMETMMQLATFVEHVLSRPDVHGVVITHGTDTMEETAYFLDLYIPTEKTICVTGAMHGSDYILSDGSHNILCAVQVALLPKTRGHGVLLVMNNEIHLASRVVKGNTSSLDAFSSPCWGPVGYISGNTILFTPVLEPKKHLRPEIFPKKVPIIKAFTGITRDFLDIVFTMGIDGLVLEGYGKGNIPDTLVPSVKQIIEAGIPVVVTSRVSHGATSAEYMAEGGSAHLQSIGVILSGMLNSQKARIKLIFALGMNNGHDFVVAQFQNYAESTLPPL